MFISSKSTRVNSICYLCMKEIDLRINTLHNLETVIFKQIISNETCQCRELLLI